MKWKTEKGTLGFCIYIKYGKFWSLALELFIKHKPLFSEECSDQFFELISPWCMQRGGFRLHYTQSFVGQQWRHHHNNCLHCAQSEQTLLWKVDRFSVSLSNFLWGTERVVRWFKRFKKYFYKDSYCLCFLICSKQPRPFHQTYLQIMYLIL